LEREERGREGMVVEGGGVAVQEGVGWGGRRRCREGSAFM
jgi:hypothetical protein